MHTEATDIDEAVDKRQQSNAEASRPAFEEIVEMEGVTVENELTSDEGNIETRPKLNEDQRLMLNSAEFDPKFDPQHAPRIALLCQTCHTALQTASGLADSETQRQRLASGALRVKVWGMDMFDSRKYAPLDELLDVVSGSHTSLKRHVLGVWADLAATLETVLFLLIRQTSKISPERCAQWRRLRIVLGLDDISSAIHVGFRLSKIFDGETVSNNLSEVLDSLLGSLEELIDCLFDVITTISTIQQMHKLGHTAKPSNSRDPEPQVVESTEKAIGESPTSPSPAKDTVAKTSPLLTSEKQTRPKRRRKGSQEGLADNGTFSTETTLRAVPKRRSDGMITCNATVHDGPIEAQTRPVRQNKETAHSFKTTEALMVSVDKARTSVEKRNRASSAGMRRVRKPIKFIDCHGRTFTFPFSECCTWTVG